jgi:hypothetical protein
MKASYYTQRYCELCLFFLCLVAGIPNIPCKFHRREKTHGVSDQGSRNLRTENKEIRILILGLSLNYCMNLGKGLSSLKTVTASQHPLI